jgi:hypothetical protein
MLVKLTAKVHEAFGIGRFEFNLDGVPATFRHAHLRVYVCIAQGNGKFRKLFRLPSIASTPDRFNHSDKW